MRSRKKHSIHSILAGWFLLLAIFLGATTDSRASSMVEHTHAEGHHQHEFQVQDPHDIHSDHPDGEDVPEDHDDPHSKGDTHHHQVDLPHIPFCAFTDFSGGLMPPLFDRSNCLPASEAGIEGPTFELIKPPQIG